MTRHPWPGAALAAAVLMLAGSGSAWASSNRIALVVGDGQYAGQPALPACSKTAHAVSARLQREGFIVNESIDGSAVALRDALSDFAGRAAASHEPALVYICTEAIAVDRRLFVLPADVDLQQPLRPETQGVVLRALLNAMAGTQGTMIAELSLRPGANAAPVTAALQEALPEGLHLALTVGDGKQAGTVGNRLADDATPLDRGWDPLVVALQGPAQGTPTAVTLYDPPPAAPPVAVAAVAPPPAAEDPRGTVLPGTPAETPPADASPAAGPDAGPTANPAAPDATPAAKPVPSPRTKPVGEERIRRLQAALTKHGFYSGPLDGVADSRTVQAILSYQISVGDPPSGTLTQTEIIRMLNNW